MMAVVVVRRALVLVTLAGGTLVWWQALADLRHQHDRLEGALAFLETRLIACLDDAGRAEHELESLTNWVATLETLVHSLCRANLDERVAALEAAEDARHKGLPVPRTPRPRKERAP